MQPGKRGLVFLMCRHTGMDAMQKYVFDTSTFVSKKAWVSTLYMQLPAGNYGDFATGAARH